LQVKPNHRASSGYHHLAQQPGAQRSEPGASPQEKKEKLMAETLYASFADASQAEKAVGALMDYGVRSEDLSLVTSGSGTNYTTGTATSGERAASGTEATGNRIAQAGDRTAAAVSRAVGAQGTAANYEAAADQRDAIATAESTEARTGFPTTHQFRDTDNTDNTERAGKAGLSTTTPQDAGAGAAKGAGIGLGVGVLAALASMFIPGIGLVIGGGALATAIGGAVGTTVAGAVSGGVLGYLKDQGMSEPVATNYAHALEQGGAILAVTVPSGDVDQATIESVLSKYGATNINTYAASYSA
jgi:hypothetical protein